MYIVAPHVEHDVQQGLLAIQNLNLDKALGRLCEAPPLGKGWTKEEANLANLWYRRFLTLALKYPTVSLVPSMLIDELWHQHMLDTRQYRKDCEAINGDFIHHYPYFGDTANGGDDQLAKRFAETNQLYISEFGEDCTNTPLGYMARSCCGPFPYDPAVNDSDGNLIDLQHEVRVN